MLKYRVDKKPFPESPTVIACALFKLTVYPGSKTIVVPEEFKPMEEILNKQGQYQLTFLETCDAKSPAMLWLGGSVNPEE